MPSILKSLLTTLALALALALAFSAPASAQWKPSKPIRIVVPFTPGSLGGTVLVARQDALFSTVREMVDYAKRKPGKLNVASYGIGTTGHLNIEFLKRVAGIDVTRIPNPGPAQANQDLYAGRIVNTPEFRKFIFESGLDYGGMVPADFTTKMRSDYERWGRVISEAAIKLD